MKKILKTNLIIIALLLAIGIQAQDQPIQFGVKAGVNLANITDGNAIIGFKAGVSLDYALSENQDWYLLTGLNYSLQGSKSDEIEGESLKLNLSYLQLPIHAGYKLEISEGTKLVLHAGPYLGYAVDGKWKAGSVSVNAFSDEAEAGIGKLKRFDFGLGLGAGLEFGKFGVDLGWDFGLAKLNETGDSSKNMNAYLTVGYKF